MAEFTGLSNGQQMGIHVRALKPFDPDAPLVGEYRVTVDDQESAGLFRSQSDAAFFVVLGSPGSHVVFETIAFQAIVQSASPDTPGMKAPLFSFWKSEEGPSPGLRFSTGEFVRLPSGSSGDRLPTPHSLNLTGSDFRLDVRAGPVVQFEYGWFRPSLLEQGMADSDCVFPPSRQQMADSS